MNGKNIRSIICSILLGLSFLSCKKYLDAKPDSELSTPSTLEDLQAVIDNYSKLNTCVIYINDLADEYYTRNADWTALPNPYKDLYIWQPRAEDKDDWIIQYKSVFYVNTVLDNLENINSQGQEQQRNQLKGAALFFRAHCFYQLAQLYAKTYDKNSAATDAGIPLRLSSDFNKGSSRATIQQTYERIIQDLQESLSLLPDHPLYKTRPGRAAAFGLLARTWLQMGEYAKAGENAAAGLQLSDSLLNYNDLDLLASAPVPLFNKEVILGGFNTASLTATTLARIDTNLYQSYDANDLRKAVFFQDNGDGSFSFRGSYNGSTYDVFQGIAVDELFLVRAECYARAGNTTAAMQHLNQLLNKRWKEGTFIPLSAATPQEALSLVLRERKKELVFRGIRWSDLKRLNKETTFATTLKRVLNGQSYLLPPNDLRYVLLIPKEVIDLTGIRQNER